MQEVKRNYCFEVHFPLWDEKGMTVYCETAEEATALMKEMMKVSLKKLKLTWNIEKASRPSTLRIEEPEEPQLAEEQSAKRAYKKRDVIDPLQQATIYQE